MNPPSSPSSLPPSWSMPLLLHRRTVDEENSPALTSNNNNSSDNNNDKPLTLSLSSSHTTISNNNNEARVGRRRGVGGMNEQQHQQQQRRSSSSSVSPKVAPPGSLVMKLSLKGTMTSLVMATLLLASVIMNAALLRMSYQQSVSKEKALTRQLREIVSHNQKQKLQQQQQQLRQPQQQPTPTTKKRHVKRQTAKAAVAEKKKKKKASTPNGSSSSGAFVHQTESAPTCDSILSPDDISYTLVTQASDDRVWMMKYHCRRWGRTHKVSVAVFTDRSYDEVMQEMMGEGGEGAEGCTRDQLTLQIMNNNTQGGGAAAGHYPVNALRNMALSAVKTSHVVYVDVDFWVPSDLYNNILQTTSVREVFAQDYKLAAVMPAFQMNREKKNKRQWQSSSSSSSLCNNNKDKDEEECRDETAANVPSSAEAIKTGLSTTYESNNDNNEREGRGEGEGVPVVDVFDPKNVDAHSSTDYSMWMTQPVGDLNDITCIKSYRYEPYLVFRYCRDLPPFQESFTGYGKNKIQWIMHLRRTGYKFKQLGGSFAIHYPHKPSEARKLWEKKPKELWGKTTTTSSTSTTTNTKNTNSIKVAEAAAVAKVDLKETKRGQVDAIFSDFKKWLYDNVPDTSRTPLCTSDAEEEPHLWITNNKLRA